MENEDLSDRLTKLENRLARIEEALRLSRSGQPIPPHIPARPPPLPPQPTPITPVMESMSPTTAPSDVFSYLSTPISPPRQANMERTIGLKWAGWVGALVLVIGAGLGIQFAYDQGWFAAISPSIRLILLALIGLALMACGEWVFRKINHHSAVGPFAAGIAILFLTAYTGYAYYGLYPRGTAFGLMMIAVLFGAAVAIRGSLASIAVLSLIGGLLAPALLPTQNPQLVEFFGYLLALQAVSLFLAWFGGTPKWWTTRAVSLIGICIWLAVVIESISTDSVPLALLFVFFYALLYQSELILTAAPADSAYVPAAAEFSTLVTAIAVAGILALLRDHTDAFRATCVLGVSIAAGLLAAALWFSSKARPALRVLCFGFVLQAVALFVLVIPVALSGLWIAAAWGLLALVFAVLAALLNLRTSRFAAGAVWALAVVKVFLWTWDIGAGPHNRINQIWLSLPGLSIPAYIVMVCLLALAGHMIAILIRPAAAKFDDTSEAQLPHAMAVFASLIWIGCTLFSLPALATTAGMAILAAILILQSKWLNDPRAALHATAIVALAALKWLTIDTVLTWGSTAPLIINWTLLTPNTVIGLALAVEFLLAARGPQQEISDTYRGPSALTAAKSLAVLVLLWAGSMEINRAFTFVTSLAAVAVHRELAEQVVLSIFWATFAVGSVIAGFYRPSAPLRYFGLALFGVTILKVVLVDLSQVSAGYRILSFIGLGALLLCTSVLYGKLSPRLLHHPTPDAQAAKFSVPPQSENPLESSARIASPGRCADAQIPEPPPTA